MCGAQRAKTEEVSARVAQITTERWSQERTATASARGPQPGPLELPNKSRPVMAERQVAPNGELQAPVKSRPDGGSERPSSPPRDPAGRLQQGPYTFSSR